MEFKVFEGAQASGSLKSGSVNILGFEFDGTACFRKGTVKGPDAIRDVAYGIETYSPYLNLDLDQLQFYDIGNLNVGTSEDAEQNWEMGNADFHRLLKSKSLASEKIKILTLGENIQFLTLQ